MRIISKTRLHTTGCFATGQCDRWKNIAKASVVTSMIIVDFEGVLLRTHNISAEAKTAQSLLQHVMEDIKYAEKEYEVTIAAWCTDAVGDAKKMRKDLVKQMPWIISLNCSAHQVNLVVCDLFKLKSAYLKTVDKATEVIKWFNHHSCALGLLRKEQLGTYQKILALIQPVITHWTCHFLSTRRLLETSGALRSCCIKKKRSSRNTVLDVEFWPDITLVKIHLEPLAVAANILQSSDTHLDTTLLTWGNFLSKRWLQMDQDMFISAVIMNPYVCGKGFARGNPLLSPVGLYNITKRTCERMLRIHLGLEFHSTFFKYLMESNEFSSSLMGLTEWKQLCEQEQTNVNLVRLWERLDTGISYGCNILINFASSENMSRSCSDIEYSDLEGASDASATPSLTNLIHDIAANLHNPIIESGPGNTTPVLIPLKDLFDYTLSMDVDYWTGGFRKLDEELARYNILETSTPSI
ncbi:hypothetical protein SCLCIDRAFT_34376 [Scleroderma citrinum Foug A]|uniref:DUF659 domain-containing protein n=1 Tax=Scleroderma citrinum Foug A TaxID=1036808 RepID=A0A0C3CP24_9AGAM|nr:hypothetical protein SCLCIDRAFT_34376 [Scleroderma citrinum Foug A]